MRDRATRIRRPDGMPGFALHEAERCHKYLYVVPVSHGVELHHRLTKNRSVGLSKKAVLKTEFFGWLMASGKRVGALQVFRYDPDRCSSNEHFCEVMDREDGDAAKLALMLSDFWEDVPSDLTWAGPILDFRFAWVDRGFPSGDLLRDACRLVKNQVFPKYSIGVMKAAPLEYLDHEDEDDEYDCSLSEPFRRRQAAMMRLYSRALGVRPFPGEPGTDGWMWELHPKFSRSVMPAAFAAIPKAVTNDYLLASRQDTQEA